MIEESENDENNGDLSRILVDSINQYNLYY